MNMTGTDQVDIVGNNGNYKNEMVKRSLGFKNINRAIGYLILVTKQIFPQLRQLFTKASIF